MIAANIDAPTTNDATLPTVNTELENSRSGSTGSAARRSWNDEQPDQYRSGDRQTDDRRRAPRVLAAAPDRDQQQHVTAPTSNAEPR